ncbi:MAG TPA: TIGR02597 family protein [Candidatus Methylacidiphilales bacterium]|nr:TIGR02597 family protein [Candidatus Methylacidiphilales bacterium]
MSIQAQTYTVPEGVLTFSLPAGPSTTYLSLPLTSDPSYRGVVSSVIAVTSNTIAVDDSPAPWTAGALANLYFVKFLSGNETGRVVLITANTTNSLTLDTSDNSTGPTVSLTTSGFNVQAGDAFEIFPADTLASLFGDNTAQSPLLLVGSSAYLNADVVSVYVTSFFKFQSYYFNTTAGYWELKGSTANANNTILYPYGALTIFRRTGSTVLSFTVMGRVAEVPILTKTGTNAAVFGSSNYPVDLTLGQLDLGSHWQTSTAYLSADVLSLYTPALFGFQSYFETPTPTWRTKSSATDESSLVTVHAGDVISLYQRNTTSGAASFLSAAMPYTFPANTDF